MTEMTEMRDLTNKNNQRPDRRTKHNVYQRCGVDDQEDVKRAQKLSWVFLVKGEPLPFTLEYNSTTWPEEITLLDKINMKPGRRIDFKTSACGEFRAKLWCVSSKARKDDAAKSVSEKIRKAVEEGQQDMSDISLSLGYNYLFFLRNGFQLVVWFFL